MDAFPIEAQQEITRLRNEVHAKEETLNQLKAKTKSFVDNMRNELAGEKKKVVDLEEALKHAKVAATISPAGAVHTTEEVENLKKEIATITHRENEFKARTKTFADSMKVQLQTEKDKTHKLESDLAAALSSSSTGSSQPMATLQAKLDQAQHETAALRDQLSRAQATTQELEAARISTSDQIHRLESEIRRLQSHEQALEATRHESSAALEQEHGQLESLRRQNEQYRIDNDHLQKQLLDKDYLLEQSDAYRQRAEDGDASISKLQAERTTLQTKLSEMAALYEKVNMGRSQSDMQLVEAQTALVKLRQTGESTQSRLDEVLKQNAQLTETIVQKDAEITVLKGDIAQLMNDKTQLQSTLSASKSDSFTRKQQAESLENEKKRVEETLRVLQPQIASLEKKCADLQAHNEAITKDSNEKRQKAKALCVSLTNEKQALADGKMELQKEVDRLRMELNQKNVEYERRLKQLQEENQQRLNQSASSVQSLNDEISTLQQTLHLIQESERNQQRAKELANAKRDVEDANKKRLAAKAETQKLALELESIQKSLNQLAEQTATTSQSSVKKMNHMQERVDEALMVLEKRASAAGKKKHGNGDIEVEDLRGVETASIRPSSPASGTRKVEDHIVRMTDSLTTLLEVTDKLCELSIEQNDVNLKDVVVDKFTQLFTQCFSEKLRAAYSKVEDTAEALSFKS